MCFVVLCHINDIIILEVLHTSGADLEKLYTIKNLTGAEIIHDYI